jgi:CheY-like chemotaxis protein
MAPDTKTRAFEPFFTTKASRRGTGLGLASVARIVQQGGGAIRLESAPGEGTTFVILLPVHLRGAETPIAAADALESSTPTATATVLVVEDDPAVREIVATMLRDLGCRALEADGLEGALTALRNAAGGVDLVVSDVMMDGLAGPDLVARLRERVPGLKVLFMSGYSEDEAIADLVARGEAVFVRKPFTRQILAKWLRRALGTSSHLAPAT